MNAASDEYDLERPRDEHDVVVALAEVAHDAVARACRRATSRRPRARRSRRSRARRRRRGARRARARARANAVRSGALPVMLLTPSMQMRRGSSAVLREAAARGRRGRRAEPLQRRAARLRELAAVVDRLVRAAVEEDRAAAGQHRDHRHVDQRDRRQHERVLAAEQLGQPLLDLLVEDRDCRAGATSSGACPSARGSPGPRR